MNIKEVKRSKLTAVMQQYYDIKINHLDELVFFQLGDFYEMFFEDAKIVSEEIQLTLTGKTAGLKEKIPMAGVPLSSVNDYLKVLIDLDYTIVIVDQILDDILGKKIVTRKISKIVSKGTLFETDADNKFVGAIAFENNELELAYGDVSTGELYTYSSNQISDIKDWILKYNILEIIIESTNVYKEYLNKELSTTKIKIRDFNEKYLLSEDFLNTSLISTPAKKNLMSYFSYTQAGKIDQFKNVDQLQTQKYMYLSQNTQTQLELTEKSDNLKSKDTTLFKYLNRTQTSMGRRYLKKIILTPLIDKKEIINRQERIGKFIANPLRIEEIQDLLEEIYDFERLLGKLSLGYINPLEVNNIKKSLKIVPKLFDYLQELELDKNFQFDQELRDKINKIFKRISSTMMDEVSQNVKDDFIRKGFSKKIDELYDIKKNSEYWLLEFEQKEIAKTGIKNLKVKYNKIFGYFIEVTKSNVALVPENYIRKQTTVNSERFITDELKEKEYQILNSQELLSLEQDKIFKELVGYLFDNMIWLQDISKKISEIDVFLGFSILSIEKNLVKPKFVEQDMKVLEARHPIVEENVTSYIYNDIKLQDDANFLIITGPNMAGKSTYMRMLALISIMAQIGSYVPASSANLKIYDALFTRIGSADNLAEGMSTFMVEMMESKEALIRATKNSLLIFDELGRGTSTYDGIALAQGIINYIISNIGATTLFSTHYHELVQRTEEVWDKKVKFVYVHAEEKGDNLTFYHKISEGYTEKSYGIEVANIAGLPKEIIKSAKIEYQSLNSNKQNLEKEYNEYEKQSDSENEKKDSLLIEELKNISIDSMTPLEAITYLQELKERIENIEK